MSIKFNSAACMTALRAHVIATLLVIQEEYKALAESHMLTPEGQHDLTSEEITILGDFIMANVGGGAWAVMDEWGKGSLMDTSNPALADYKASNMWNPERSDNTIRSRSRAQNGMGLTDIFGTPIHSNSNVGGIDLEQKGGKYTPQPPSHAMETAGRWMANGRIQTKWREAMMAFPWGNFIVATPD